MPTRPTYPGVYVEEIPSGVRTITGVATSITAFLGRAVRGEVNESVTIHNFGDFERLFGGLHVDYPMSYAVRDFYLNGGSEAIIVRLFATGASAAQEVAKAAEDAANQPNADKDTVKNAARNKANEIKNDAKRSTAEKSAAEEVAKAAEDAANQPNADKDTVKNAARNKAEASDRKARLTLGTDFKLETADPGVWGNKLKVRVDREGIDDELAKRYGLQNKQDLFNLTIREDGPDGSEERIQNVSVAESPRRVDRVLTEESRLVRVQHLPQKAPENTPSSTTSGGGTGGGSAGGSASGGSAGSGGGGTAGGVSGNGASGGAAVLTQLQAAAQELDKLFVGPFTGGANSASLAPTDYIGSLANKTGLYALEKADLFNLLCIPPDTREDGDTPASVYQEAMGYCAKRRAMVIIDPPHDWDSASDITQNQNKKLTDLGLSGLGARNAALYFPRVLEADPERGGQSATFVPCGIIAGVMASTDVQRGVWKSPAGIDAALNGIQGLHVNLTDDENGTLNPLGVNCLRTFPIIGSVVWGARTLRGADQLADEYKYLAVRRLALYIEESLYRGLKWVVFEPNDEPLWSQIRLNVGAFMQNLFRQGAFQGQTPQQAYFVKCDGESTTQNDINLGIVNIVVGFAPLKPAEFVILKIQQMAGQIET